jgi:hypothetical protein
MSILRSGDTTYIDVSGLTEAAHEAKDEIDEPRIGSSLRVRRRTPIIAGNCSQKCSQGQNNDATCTGAATTATWATAIAYCSGLGLEGKTWRLPHVNELKTIVDTTKATSPVIDTTAFPATVASYYWSSSTYAQTTTNAWFVDFVFGLVGGLSKTANVYVRCVSGP